MVSNKGNLGGFDGKSDPSDYFDVEALEDRFEMGWLKGGEVTTKLESDGDFAVTAKLKF